MLGNEFERIPPQISELPFLSMLSFKQNSLKQIDVPLPSSLNWLILTDNQLTSLPTQIGQLTGMRKLMLANNR